jgi:WS/DGAT/MGAT family acyltransferase
MLPLGLLRAGRSALDDARRALESARDAVAGAAELLGSGLTPASPTPLNPLEIGPHRRFDWTRMDLDAVKQVKRRLGGTVNDVVLAVVAGALRRFLAGRGVAVDGLDFRAQVPVDVRSTAQRGTLGNRVATLLVRLPVHEPDAQRRYALVLEATQRLKRSSQVHGSELLEQLGDWTAKELLAGIVRGTATQLAFNMTVTNVPGPQFPAYLLGAPMLAIYPVVPLFARQAVGIALFSYDGGVYWGFDACWDTVPDLHDLVSAVEEEFGALRAT